ncbi:MAG: LEPR-XLL domain-containing protein, partial [Casimicrobiaceae bacterium]
MSEKKQNRLLELIRSMPSLREIFFLGRLARWFRLLADWRKQGRLRRELLARRRDRPIMETLEPRVMLSADAYAAVGAGAHDLAVKIVDVDGTTPTLQVLDNGTVKISHVLSAGDPYDLTINGSSGNDTLKIDFGFDRAATAAEQAVLSIKFTGGDGDDKVEVGSASATTYAPNSLSVISDEAMSVTGNLTTASNLHLEVNTTSDGGILGSNIDATSHAQLLATDAVLNAGGNIELIAHSTLTVNTSGVGDFGLQLAVVKGSSVAELVVAGNSSIDAGGNLTLSAISDVSVNDVAKASPQSSASGGASSNRLDAAVAMSIIDSSANSHVLGNTNLDASSGVVGVTAANTVHVTTLADGTANDNHNIGGTLALSVVHTDTDASLNGSVSVTAQDVNVNSTSSNDVTTTAKSTAGGAQQGNGRIPNPSEQQLATYGAATSDGKVMFAGAVAISDLDADAQAFISSGSVISASGNVGVLVNYIDHATTLADASNTGSAAIGTPGGGATGVGVAVAIDLGHLGNSAYIGDADITAKAVTVQSLELKPSAFSAQAISGVGAGNTGVAGSLAINIVTTHADAFIQQGASVQLHGAALTLTSTSSITDTAFAHPGSGGATGADLGLGASIAINVTDNQSSAQVYGKVEGAGDTVITASGDFLTATIAQGGATASGGTAITPVAAITIASSHTMAGVGELEGDVLTLGSLQVKATQTDRVGTLADATAAGADAAVGAGLALSFVQDSATATTARDIVATGKAAFAATNSSLTVNRAVASANGAKGESAGGGSADVNKQVASQRTLGDAFAASQGAQGSGAGSTPSASTSEGDVSVAAAIGINVVDSMADADIADGVSIKAGGAFSLEADNNTDAQANADASAASSAKGIGAAVAINVGSNAAYAAIGEGANVAAQGVSIQAKMFTPTDSTDTVNTMGATALAGAGGKDIGVAGSVAINIETSHVEAVIGKSASVDAGTGTVLLVAQNNTANTVSAKPKAGGASGADAGIGASLALDIADNLTRAEIEDGATVVATGPNSGLAIGAISSHSALVTAEAGAASSGGVAVAPAVALAIENNDTHVRLGSSPTATAIGGPVILLASHSSNVSTTAGGTAAGQDAAVGASLALTIAGDKTTATIDRDVTAGGLISVQALANATSNATATASASGAKGAGSGGAGDDPNAQADRQRNFGNSTATANGAKGASGSSANPKAETSDGSVAVAAAVAINIADSEARALIGDGHVVISGANVGLKATNNTDAHANADGSAVQGTDSPRVKAGIGAAVALNLGNNTAQTRVGENAKILSQGATFEASMTTVAGKDTVNSMGASATAGGAGKDVGIAGAVAINVETSTAQTEIASGASIDAGAGKIGFVVTNNTDNSVGAHPKAGGATGGDAGIGASLALDLANNSTGVDIDAGVTMVAAGDLSIAVTSAHRANVSAEAGAASTGGVAVAPAAAIAIENNDTHVALHGGAAIAIGGAIDATAKHTSAVVTTAGGTAAGSDAAIGASLALTIANDNTHVDIDGNIAAAGNVSFQAIANAASNANASASASGAPSAGGSSPGSAPDAQSAKQRGFGDHVASEHGTGNSGGTATPKAQTSSGSVTVAAAVGINIATSQARVNLEDNRSLVAGGSVLLKATNNTDAHASADGSAVNGKVGVGVAVALNFGDNVAQARIGENASIAGKGVSLQALMTTIPGDPADSTNSMGATAVAGAGGKDIGIAGAVAINVENSTAEAVVAAGGTADGGAGTVDLQAQNTTSNDVSARPKAGGATGGDAGIGASLALDIANNTTRAEVEDTGVVTTTGAAGDVSMKATSNHTAKVTAEAGAASSSGVAVAPAVALAIENNDTHVRLGAAAAAMSIGGSLRGVADHRSTVETDVGGTAAGKDAAIGASLALTLASDDTHANVDGDVVTGKDIDFQALAAANSNANATASASGAHGSGSRGAGDDPNAQAKQQRDFGNSAAATSGVKGSGASSANPRAATSGGDVAVAAAVAINIADSKASASVGNGRHLVAGGSVGLTATNNTDAHASARGSAVGADVGVGAAVALNVGNNLAQARVGENATIQSKGVNMSAGVTALDGGKDTVNSMGATAVAGAGGKDVGIAGAVAINFESSTAEAVVAAGANVDGGTGGIAMQAQNTTSNEVSARPLAGGATGGDAGIGASLALDIANNLTRAEVEDTGAVTTTGAAGDVSMKATSQHAAKVTAEAGAASSGGVAVAPAVALAIENNDTHVRLGAAVPAMTIGGSLRGVAEHRSSVETDAGGIAAGKDAAIGASLALTLANDDTQANVDGDVITGKDIDFQALAAADSKANATASASGAHGSGSGGAGDDPNAQAKQQRDFGNSAAASSGVKGSGSSSANPRAETSGGDVTVAAAVAINIADSKASANVGDGKHLIADGSVGLTATNNTDAHANASGSAVQGAAAGQQADVGIGAAVALNVGNNLAQARVGENATIQSQGANLIAGVTSLDGGKDTVNSMGAVALAGAGGKDVGIAGAVAINIESSTGEALIANGANVDGGAGTVALSAVNNTLNVVTARPIAAGASGGDAGIGVSVALDLANNLTRAELVGSGNLTTTGDATMNATSSHLAAVVAEAGAASSGGVGVAPAVAMAFENNSTLVALDAGATLAIGGSITATAQHTSLEGSIAGGTAAGSDAAVGASLALTVANDSTKAVIDRDVTAGGDVNFNALASATSVAIASASASGAHPSASGSGGDDPNAQAQTQRNFGDHVASELGAGNSGSTTNPKAETSGGAVTVAAAVAINVANSSAQALLADGRSVIAGGSLGLKATNNTDAHANADGSAVQGKVGIGAAVALNLGNNSAQARIGENAQVQSVGVNLNATMTPLSTGTDTVSSMGATAVAGGAGKDVGIAGAVAINIENSKAEALVATGAAVDGSTGNVVMVAQNNTANVVSARPKAGGATGGDAGIGASLALDLANNLTRAEILDGATVTTSGTGNLLMGAVSDHSANVTAEAGAASSGGVAVAPAVALAIENNDTHVRLGTSASPVTVGGNLTAIAAHKSNVQTNAGGTAAGKDAAVGASLALTIATDKTIATTDRDIAATGNVSLQALAAAASQANATASAVGAKGTDEAGGSGTPNKQANDQRTFGDKIAADHGTGNSGSTAAPKAETSSGGVTVAAAVAIDIANSEARATLPDGRTIAATGSVTLKATNNTDAHSNADGSAVASSKDPEADIGIGAAVALTLGNNTAQARVGEGAKIASQGASFEASMTALPQDSANSMGAAATAGGGGKDVGVAGAVAINIENSRAEAVVAKNASVNGGAGDVSFIATNNTANATSAHPKAGGATGGDAGIGASLALDLATNVTRTEIEDTGDVTTTGNLSTDASSAHTATVSAEAGAASSGGVAVAPAVAIAIENNDTHTRFGTGVLPMSMGGAIDAKAEHSSRVSTNAGGTAVGKDAAIGASLALTYANDTTIATTDRDIAAGGDVSFQALASAASSANASASASGAAGDSSGGDSIDKQATDQRKFGDQVAGEQGVGGSGSTSTPKAETSDGGVTVAAAVGINIANSQARATLPDGRTVTAGGSFALKATNNTDAHASADGSAVLGSKDPDADVGIGAAVALNLGNNVAQARVGEGAHVTSQGVSIQALTTIVPGRLDDNTSSMGAIAKSGGGGKDVGIAGSVAINIENSTAEAVIAKGAIVDAGSGAVIMLAQNNTANITSATPLAGGATGGDAGIGASVALDLANNHTRAEVEDTAVLTTAGAAGNIGMGAFSNHTAVVTAEAGATSDNGIAVAPSVAIALENSDTHVRLGMGAPMSVGGTLLAVASHQADVSTTSGGTAAGSDAAIGAALALTIAADNTVATTDRDITAGGAVGFQALAAAASQANAKASASGAKGSGSSTRTPNAESTQQRNFGDKVAGEQGVGNSGSGSTPSADTSDGPVTVAAAVGINLAHSEAHATVPDGRTIIAGGDFGLKATNNTDATASADGS